jgi:hypothetical protein
VEAGLELGAVVGLDAFDAERELLEDVVDELDGGPLGDLRVDAQHPDAGAVVDGRELVVLLARARQGGDEFHVDLGLGGRVTASRSASSGRGGACSAANSGAGSAPDA